MTQTDEILENSEQSSSATETHAGGYQNEWGSKLTAIATGFGGFNAKFSRTELGDGQAMSVEERSRLIAVHSSRQRAGEAANAQLSADLEWGEVRVKEEKLTGKQLERGIQRAKNIEASNDLAYHVARIPLKGEKRMLQLQSLGNEVKKLRTTVKSNAILIQGDLGSTEVQDIDFTEIEVDEI